jgi:AcrR family transcriptional regulator
MPPAVFFTREAIVDAAFQLSLEEGVENITIRAIAQRLGSSIAPIYSNFGSIEELRQAVMDKAFAILEEYTVRDYSPNHFLNLGLGLLDFARQYKLLYKTLFINSNTYHVLVDEFFERNLAEARKESTLQDLTDDEIRRVLEKVRLFTHGLATQICSGNMDDKSEQYTNDLLKEAGHDIVGFMVYQSKLRAAGADSPMKG